MYPAIFEQLLLFVEFSCKPPQYGRMETKHVANAKCNQVGGRSRTARNATRFSLAWFIIVVPLLSLNFWRGWADKFYFMRNWARSLLLFWCSWHPPIFVRFTFLLWNFMSLKSSFNPLLLVSPYLFLIIFLLFLMLLVRCQIVLLVYGKRKINQKTIIK